VNFNQFTYANRPNIGRFMNQWDIGIILLIFSVVFFLGWVGSQIGRPYQLGAPLPISLDVAKLPGYALYTVLRMFIALCISLVFTIIVGTVAAKFRRAEQLIIPTLDILQSVPVLSFLSITVTGFIRGFPGSMLGPEFACLFAIFTSQVWNMTFSFYQSLKTIPSDLMEAAAMFQLSSWQRFWKIEVPFSLSALIWNMMMSMSASWFFVVLAEAINVAHQDIRLPGLGSYIALAIQSQNLMALGYAILTMMIVILLYDQLMFRPLVVWAEKFKIETSPDELYDNAWLIDWMRASRLLKRMVHPFSYLKEWLLHGRWINRFFISHPSQNNSHTRPYSNLLWTGLLVMLGVALTWKLYHYIHSMLTVHVFVHVMLLGAATAIRVILLIFLSSLLWIPVGVWIGLRPVWAQRAQPMIQLLAAFPGNLFYPLFVIGILRFNLNVELWVTPLMILGAQWYILFNVIAGASRIPRDLYLAANNLGLKGWTWWKRLALPAVFPYYITGAITASGGAWNASIVAEWVSWGSTTLKASGLGAYIQENTIAGNFPEIALGTCVMSIYVLAFNHLLWRPLYRFAEERCTLL
jgi:NitT/TauT family transport system permease protein